MAQSTHLDLYSMLGVARDASADEIRKSYRNLARASHPDLHPGDTAAEKRFKEISGAYEILSDPDKRKLYDEFGTDALRAGFDADKARAFRQWGGGGGGSSGGEVDLGELLANLFGGRSPFGGPFDPGGAGRGGRRRARGQDVLVRVDLDLRDAIRGTEIEVQLPFGGVDDNTRAGMIKVRVPPGTDDGTKLRVAGKGAPPAGGHGTNGDLLIETHIRKHPFFKREGLDLHLELPVSLSEAWDGATVEVPTPDGSVKLKVPARSKSGAKLRMRGRGVRRGDEVGDIYVRIEIQLPDGDDDKIAAALSTVDPFYSRPLRGDLAL